MAEAHLSRRQLETGSLPAVCVYCGRPAASVRRTSFRNKPPWLTVMFLVGGLPLYYIMLMTQEQVSGGVPICHAHRGRHRWSLWTFLGALGGLVFLVFPFGVLSNVDNGAVRIISVLGILAGVLVFLAGLIATIVCDATSPRMVAVQGDDLTFKGVHSGFASAAQGRGGMAGYGMVGYGMGIAPPAAPKPTVRPSSGMAAGAGPGVKNPTLVVLGTLGAIAALMVLTCGGGVGGMMLIGSRAGRGGQAGGAWPPEFPANAPAPPQPPRFASEPFRPPGFGGTPDGMPTPPTLPRPGFPDRPDGFPGPSFGPGPSPVPGSPFGPGFDEGEPGRTGPGGRGFGGPGAGGPGFGGPGGMGPQSRSSNRPGGSDARLPGEMPVSARRLAQLTYETPGDLDEAIAWVGSPEIAKSNGGIRYLSQADRDPSGQVPAQAALMAKVDSLPDDGSRDADTLRATFVDALVRWGDDAVVPTLVTFVRQDRYSKARGQAIRGLAQFPADADVVAALAETLKNGLTAPMAEETLLAIGEPGLPILVERVLDQSSRTRVTLKQIAERSPEAHPIILEQIAPILRSKSDLRVRDVMEYLKTAPVADDPLRTEIVAGLLAQVASPLAGSSTVGEVLGRWAQASDVDRIVPLLGRSGSSTDRTLLKVVEQWPTEAAVEQLTVLLLEKGLFGRDYSEALKRIGPAAEGPVLKAFEQLDTDQASRTLLPVLGEIGTKTTLAALERKQRQSRQRSPSYRRDLDQAIAQLRSRKLPSDAETASLPSRAPDPVRSTESPDGDSAVRIFRDATGKHTIEGTMESYASGEVTISQTDGTTVKIDIEALSDDDQVFVRQWLVRSNRRR